jgi:hypothetical protein
VIIDLWRVHTEAQARSVIMNYLDQGPVVTLNYIFHLYDLAKDRGLSELSAEIEKILQKKFQKMKPEGLHDLFSITSDEELKRLILMYGDISIFQAVDLIKNKNETAQLAWIDYFWAKAGKRLEEEEIKKILELEKAWALRVLIFNDMENHFYQSTKTTIAILKTMLGLPGKKDDIIEECFKSRSAYQNYLEWKIDLEDENTRHLIGLAVLIDEDWAYRKIFFNQELGLAEKAVLFKIVKNEELKADFRSEFFAILRMIHRIQDAKEFLVNLKNTDTAWAYEALALNTNFDPNEMAVIAGWRKDGLFWGLLEKYRSRDFAAKTAEFSSLDSLLLFRNKDKTVPDFLYSIFEEKINSISDPVEIFVKTRRDYDLFLRSTGTLRLRALLHDKPIEYLAENIILADSDEFTREVLFLAGLGIDKANELLSNVLSFCESAVGKKTAVAFKKISIAAFQAKMTIIASRLYYKTRIKDFLDAIEDTAGIQPPLKFDI